MMRSIAALALMYLVVLPLCGYAAQDGTLGTNSEGRADASLTIDTLYRIGGITDVDFGTYSGTGDRDTNRDICVWTNHPSTQYRVTARGSGTSYAFTIAKVGDTTKTIPYTVRWNTTSGITGNQPLDADTISSNLSGANTQSTTCASGPSATANFQITITQSHLLAARAGTYTGTLTLIISAPSS